VIGGGPPGENAAQYAIRGSDPDRGDRRWTARYRDLVDGRDGAAVPQVTFTQPQVASVGLTERVARDAGIDVQTLEYDLGSVAGAALLADGYTGRAKLHAATVAVVGAVPLSMLWQAVPSYPTMSEVWLRLLESR
jgi:hypothetical protein